MAAPATGPTALRARIRFCRVRPVVPRSDTGEETQPWCGKARRGFQVATVATARKMTVLCWHLITKDEDYAFARLSLVAHKRRALELVAHWQPQRPHTTS